MLATHLGLPRQSEILVIIFLGICFLSLDFSLFNLKSSMEKVWSIELNLDETKYLETPLKYIITGVILARTLTLHAFLAFYVVMLWPAVFEEKPSLMLPWLLLGIIRCLVLNVITFVVGTFICQKEKGFSPICFEYILTQFIEHGPSVYAWMAILNFYRELIHEETPQSSMDSLLSEERHAIIAVDNSEKSDESLEQKRRSCSLSSLNLDYLYSNKMKCLPGDASIEKLIRKIRKEFVDEKRIMKGGSKSFDDYFTSDDNNSDDKEESTIGSLTILEKSLIALALSQAYIVKAKERKGRYADVLQEISIRKSQAPLHEEIIPSSSKPGIKKRLKAIRIIQSHSENEIQKAKKCFCAHRKLQKEYSQQALLVEQEIANVTFDLNTLDKFKSHKPS